MLLWWRSLGNVANTVESLVFILSRGRVVRLLGISSSPSLGRGFYGVVKAKKELNSCVYPIRGRGQTTEEKDGRLCLCVSVGVCVRVHSVNILHRCSVPWEIYYTEDWPDWYRLGGSVGEGGMRFSIRYAVTRSDEWSESAQRVGVHLLLWFQLPLLPGRWRYEIVVAARIVSFFSQVMSWAVRVYMFDRC